jgi:hypothetical protein
MVSCWPGNVINCEMRERYPKLMRCSCLAVNCVSKVLKLCALFIPSDEVLSVNKCVEDQAYARTLLKPSAPFIFRVGQNHTNILHVRCFRQ